MAEPHPLFSILILILSALVLYWVLIGQRKQKEMMENKPEREKNEK